MMASTLNKGIPVIQLAAVTAAETAASTTKAVLMIFVISYIGRKEPEAPPSAAPLPRITVHDLLEFALQPALEGLFLKAVR